MRDILEKIKEFLAPFKLPAIVLGIVLVLFIALKTILPIVQDKRVEGSPIIEITAENDTKYTIHKEIKKKDFKVYATHDNGKSNRLSTDEFNISRTSISSIGSYTVVKITLANDEAVSCECKVKTEREKILTFNCGAPNLKDVKAVLYSNGELCFEGKGDVLEFGEKQPWKDYEEADDHPILAVSFKSGVKPTKMDNWFSGMLTLQAVNNIPDSPESMVSTFEGCEALETVSDLDNSDNLLNMSKCFSGCIALKKPPKLPSSLRIASETFAGCETIETSPNFKTNLDLVDASGMFKECKKLQVSTIPGSAENIASMFEGCINLKDMPEVPVSVTNMAATFSGCTALKSLTIVPEHVTDCSSCFEGCVHIEGMLWIDANPEDYSGFLSDAATATDVDLQGNSFMLDVLANTSGYNVGITVNGKKPDPEKTSVDLEDLQDEEDDVVVDDYDNDVE